jgi:hypothetical protein
MIDFPEGIELYDVILADPTTDVVTFAVTTTGMTALDAAEILAHVDTEMIKVRKMRGPWGWTEELRVLVVFDGAYPPVHETPLVTDEEISLECASGDRILAFEREERINLLRPDDPLRYLDEYDSDDSD